MAILSRGNSKKCVTCQYFCGDREPDAFKTSVRHEGSCKGTCLLRKQEKAANYGGCSKWEKWATLK